MLLRSSQRWWLHKQHHRQPGVKQSTLTQLLCCWCATWLDDWIAKHRAPCRACAVSVRAMPTLHCYCSHSIVWNEGLVSETNSAVYWVSLRLSRWPGSTFLTTKLRESTQRGKKWGKESRERQCWGGEQSRAAWGELRFYLHLQPLSHK